MTDRTHARLVIMAALVMSLVFTLAADQQGRALAANRIALDVAVSRRELRRLDDDGAAVLAGLGALLGIDPERLANRLRNCGTPGAAPQPDCWNGPPAADPTVARDIGIEAASPILAHPAEYPAVRIVQTPTREYPNGSLASHALGHVRAPTPDDLLADPTLAGTSGAGRAGLELQYDDQLRGRPGLERVTVDSAGLRAAAGVADPAQAGWTLVTTVDAQLQAAVERALARAMRDARGRVDTVTGRRLAADGGAAVVLDVRTGAVLALASAPTFDANVWSGGIATADYERLTDPAAGEPLLNRALAAALPPASTFKVVSTAVALDAGYSEAATYPCPATYRVGGRVFRNYETRGHGSISLERALEVSCDTVYYRLADQLWAADGGSQAVDQPRDAIATAATDFGFGSATGIDLPGESAGRVASRQAKRQQWQHRRDQWCSRAESGYPEVADRARAAYLTALARENCADGMRWRVGDALNAAIGQGDTTATVLQVATAYAAIANGGTLWRPHLGRALLEPDGSVATEFEPVASGSLDVPAADLAFLRAALRGVVEDGTARSRFAGFPLDQVPVAGKTGTAEVYGKQTTSWFASFAPADRPRYAVVVMVEQGGTGGATAGLAVREIHEALFGVEAGAADRSRSVLLGGDVATSLPRIGPDGVPVAPGAQPPEPSP